MSFFDLVDKRHSSRAFTGEGVSEESARKILAAANRAPSAGNQQAYEIVVVRDPERKRQLAAAAYEQSFIADAPLVLVFLTHAARNAGRYGTRGAELYALQDATIAAAYAQLAVQALELGSVWVGAVEDEAVLKAVAAPKGLGFSSLLVIGHPSELPQVTPRRSLDDLVHREQVRSR